MSDPVTRPTSPRQLLLQTGWQVGRTTPERITDPGELADARIEWIETQVPSTVAAALQNSGQWHLDQQEYDLDAFDWWYRRCITEVEIRSAFSDDPASASASELQEVAPAILLHCAGLATLVDVWLNGMHILHSENMFRSYDCEVSDLLQPNNVLTIRFASVARHLQQRRPRPRWKAPMIAQQQLRWVRTTVLGRTPGWSPPAPPIGPWREVWLASTNDFRLTDSSLHTSVCGQTGKLAWSGRIHCSPANRIVAATLQISSAGQCHSGTIKVTATNQYRAELAIERPVLWWPHTHGLQHLYTVELAVEYLNVQDSVHRVTLALGQTAFRQVELNRDQDNFQIRINNTAVFCRGACWTPINVISLNASDNDLRTALHQVRDAGMNMLRVGGTMVYECDRFYELCDELGIMVWQDFMFANMDYPETTEFINEVAHEVTEQLQRLSPHPCITVLCGNSEVEQQAAMFGAIRDLWSPSLFHQTLAALVAEQCPHLPYWPSSAHGGGLPFQNDVGTTSYYGVGAYLRPLDDARHSKVKFATECLAFANVPEDSCIESMPGGLALRVHHPQWKARTPRDLGAGWDFEDVRDHYLTTLFNVNPMHLRYSDHDRYLALSRVVTGEVMATTFNEWRSQPSACQGALIWLLRDLWAGAGWGIVDANGRPKPAYYYLRRVLQPLWAGLSDEGGNGIYLHFSNEHPVAFNGHVELSWYHHGETLVNRIRKDLCLNARERRTIACTAWLDYFSDLNHAYRFGPAPCDVMVLRLFDAGGRPCAEDWLWPQGRSAQSMTDIGLDAEIIASPPHTELSLRTRILAQSITIHLDHHEAPDQYFHLAPGEQRTLIIPNLDGLRITGQVRALNCTRPIRIRTSAAGSPGSSS